MSTQFGDVPFLDPETGRFPDDFAPPSVAADKTAAQEAAQLAANARGDAEGFSATAGTLAGQASTAAGEAMGARDETLTARDGAVTALGEAQTAAQDAGDHADRAEQAAADATAPTDEMTASLIETPESLTATALSAAIAEQVDPVAGMIPVQVAHAVEPIKRRGNLSGIFSLIACTEDETLVNQTPATGRSVDTVNYKIGGQGWKQTNNFAGTLLQRYSGPVNVPPFQAVCLWVYVEDATKVNDIGMRLYFDAAGTTANRWSRAFTAPPAQTIVTGWNFFRIPADWSGSTITDRSTIHEWEVYAVTNAGTSMTIGHYYLETPSQARCMIVADRGYQRFYDGLYQDLKARNIPVTWAVDVTLFGSGTVGGASEAISEALLHEVAQENGNSISFHGWDGAITATMTPEQLRIDTIKAIKWLQRYGYEGRMWRAAYVQNAATAEAHAAVKGLLVGASTPRSISSLTIWPPKDMHDIPRHAMDNNASLASITGWFDKMRSTRMTGNIFVHSQDEVNQYDYSAARRAHFLAEIDAVIADGSVHFSTFEELYREAGGLFQSLNGAHVAQYTDAAGNLVNQPVL